MPEARLASAPPEASEAYAAREGGIAPSCGQRYRSYDPASGIFLVMTVAAIHAGEIRQSKGRRRSRIDHERA